MARLAFLGLEDCIPKLKARGHTTYATFAFACDYTPSQADASVLINQLLKPIAEDESQIPLLRMLWWESWGIATSDMKRMADGTEGEAPRKLTPAELSARRTGAESRLVGISFTPEIEVSDTVIKEGVGMAENGRLDYMPWEQCTTQDMDIAGKKKENKTAAVSTELQVDQV